MDKKLIHLFTITNIPGGPQSLAIIEDDADAQNGTFIHWWAWNIESGKTISKDQFLVIEGTNSPEKMGYIGSCPLSGADRYCHFKVRALDIKHGL